MTKRFVKAILTGSVAVAAVVGFAAVAAAQSQQQQTPRGWSYEIKNGQRVPKGTRVVNADGSWREEMRQGKCVTIKEKTASGEYRETRQCEPGA